MKPHAISVAAVLAVPTLLAGYVASYFVLLTPIRQGPIAYPHYRLGGEIALTAFMPVHRRDRNLRRDFWGTLPND